LERGFGAEEGEDKGGNEGRDKLKLPCSEFIPFPYY
jgi:hypothetical protein